MKIQLLKKQTGGSVAALRLSNGEYSDVLNSDADAQTACLIAAENLRRAARRFEMLASVPEPYRSIAQDKINETAVTNDG